jgi:hypothetical protein
MGQVASFCSRYFEFCLLSKLQAHYKMQARKVKTRTHLKLKLSKSGKPKKSTPIKVWFAGRVYKM